MEYVVGSVATLISGNITPSRSRGLKRTAAATPVKHPPSPNITPKSELVDDRSIFLSPTTQKKKSIVKKSPKRIFQNPELNETKDKENLMTSKADKVKKHLKREISGGGTSCMTGNKVKSKSSNCQVQPDAGLEEAAPQRASDCTQTVEIVEGTSATQQHGKINQSTEIKKNKKSKKNRDRSECLIDGGETDTVIDNMENQESNDITTLALAENRKKKKKRKQSMKEAESVVAVDNLESQDSERDHTNITNEDITRESKKMKRKLKSSIHNSIISNESPLKKIKVNPNAITNKDTDSEHESDNEIESENDKEMDEVLPKDQSASEDEDQVQSNNLKPKKKIAKMESSDIKEGEATVHDPEEVNRTLFVGNVPFSKKCKKEIKKIFSCYGDIETVRIRSVPVKDPRFTPKLAVIRNELHPERSAVNVYVKFKQTHSVQQALVENGRSLNEHTLRVSACVPGGGTRTHTDTRCSLFVGNVPFCCADDELRALFAACGRVQSVRLVRDPLGVGKGFGYVNFECKDSVELALSLTAEQRTLKNRELRVKRCTISERDRNKLTTSSAGQAGTQPRGQYGARGQTGAHPRGNYGVRGQARAHPRDQYGARGQGGVHPRGQYGARGQSGVHPRGQYGARGQTGVRGRGGRTDTQRGERQGAARRLDHKKNKKHEEKPSRKKNALAEIMSK